MPLGERDLPNIVVVVERSGCLVYKHAVMVSDSFWNFLFFSGVCEVGGCSAGGSRIRETGAEVIGVNWDQKDLCVDLRDGPGDEVCGLLGMYLRVWFCLAGGLLPPRCPMC